MAIFVPDISHHQVGINVQALKNEGAAALIARVGQGAGRKPDGDTYGNTRDREWPRHRDEARRVGLHLTAYWYVGNLITAEENARLAWEWVGDDADRRTIRWMLDHENASGAIAHYHAVAAAFERRGMRVVLGYVPRWYWEGTGNRAPLTPGPPLVNSRYPSTPSAPPAQMYQAINGDKSAAWVGYGGQTVALWQFTSQALMAGRKIDCSAFKGTQQELIALLSGEEQDMQADERKALFEALDLIKEAVKQLNGAMPDGSAPAPNVYPGWPTWAYNDVDDQGNQRRSTLVDFVRVLHREAASFLPLEGRPGGDNDTQFGHVLSTRAELRGQVAPAIDYDALVEALADNPAAQEALAKAFADEMDRRARDGRPETGPTT